MNREEAKYYLQSSGFSEEQIDTIEKAFTSTDAISRQAVLDLAKKGILISNGNYESVCKAINELPSVTPQPSISQPDIEAIRQEIETEMNLCRMKDTVSKGYKGKILEEVLGKIDKYIQKPQEKWIDEDDNRYICKECEYAHKPQKEPCEDAIDRAEAIKIASGYCHPANVAKELAKLPSVTPQPKTGHWIYTGDYITEGMLKCSECGFEHDVSERFAYCPNCGAKMVEPQERSDKE